MGWPMRAHWRYASYVARHKWFVFRAGLKTGAPLWRLVIHDWSKLTPAEWFPYVQTFYGRDGEFCREAWRIGVWLRLPRGHRLRDSAAFDKAWLHHQHRSPHHWQHWLLREDDGPVKALPMPEPLVREMVADWMGAGRAITGRWGVDGWYAENAQKMLLAPETRALVEGLLSEHPAADAASASSARANPEGTPESAPARDVGAGRALESGAGTAPVDSCESSVSGERRGGAAIRQMEEEDRG